MGITEHLTHYITAFIAFTGYPAVFFLMILESMVFPVPSEAVMPFAGFLIAEGKMSWLGVIAFSTFGSIVGSSISYAIGIYGGKPFLDRFGKYFLINHEDLVWTERFFKEKGELAILISRFIPVVRHLISLPAGIAKMNFWKFLLFTILGAGLWNAFLTWVGFLLRQKWDSLMRYSHVLDIVVLAILVSGGIYFIYKHLRPKK
jgi:membrane protein DedA with SNARE-associated domain